MDLTALRTDCHARHHRPAQIVQAPGRERVTAALGQPTHECWPEFRHITAPIYERVWRGESLVFEDAQYPLARSGVCR